MPSSRRRCVFGCVTEGLTMHQFPNPARLPEQFKTWVELAGEQLKNLSPEEIYPRKTVCDKHFIASHRNRNNRLSALAIPTLHLPNSQAEPNACDASENIPVDTPMSLDQGLHAEAEQSLEEGSAKHKMPSQNSFTFALDLSADTGASDDPDDRAQSAGRPSVARQVAGKSFMAQKMQGLRRRTFLSYHQEAERKIRNLQQENLRLRQMCKSYKSRLEDAKKLSDNKVIIIML
ncbi:uncharacterized protein [Maniola hyperantus]|uniref:uncharacterized protein isoform X2 n=1 Tax=Aphantopus hyperantus TaxID=2795564 RepID=UPI003749FF77